jgi:hypothetical protein
MKRYGEWYELINLSTPVAGAALTYRIPGETWVIVTIARFTIVASAAVANRYPTVDFLSGDQTAFTRMMSPNALTAGLTRNETFSSDLGGFVTSAGGEEMGQLPEMVLPPGFRVRITAANLDVADQISAASLYVCRLPSGKWVESPGASPYDP